MKKQASPFFPERLTNLAFFAIMGCTLLLCLFSWRISYALKLEGQWPDWLCLGLGTAFAALLSFLFSRKSWGRGEPRRWILLGTVIGWCLSVFVFNQAGLHHPYDSESLYEGARELVETGESASLTAYLSQDPNNLLLAWLYTLLWRLALLLGLGSAYILLLPIQCGIVAVSLYLVYRGAEMTVGREKPAVPVILWCIGALFLFFNPKVTENYSDPPAMLVVTLCAFLYLKVRQGGSRRPLYLGFLGFFSMAGYFLKPLCSFVLIAAFLVSFLPAVIRSRKKWRKALLCALALLCGLVLAFGCVQWADGSLGLTLDHERELSAVHYLMMGLNSQGGGIFWYNDLVMSVAYPTYAERQAANWAVTRERVSTAGFKGMAVLMLRKLLTNLNDGTFDWHSNVSLGEDMTWADEMPLRISGLDTALRDFFAGSGFPVLHGLMQSLWLAILLLGAAGSLRRREDGLCVLRLAVLGLILFVELFEASPRFLYAFAPVLLLLAGGGLALLPFPERRKA